MTSYTPNRRPPEGEEGYLLLGLVVVCFLLALALAVAAPRVAKQLERDREVESEHRALEYVRGIQLFYKKNSRYPTSIDELLGKSQGGISLGGSSTNVHYLRQQYKDPLTGGDYKLIHFGEAKTEVKGFFGEPLQGLPVGGLGSAAGMQSNLGNSAAGTFGASTSSGLGSSSSSSSTLGSSTGTTGSTSSTGTQTGATSGSQTDVTSTLGGTSATSFQGSKGAIIGVGSNGKGHGLVEWNGSENIEDWEFLYDPRVEILKQKVSIFGGSPAANGSGSFGSSTNMNGTGFGSSTSTTGTSTGTSGTSSGTSGTSGSSTNPF